MYDTEVKMKNNTVLSCFIYVSTVQAFTFFCADCGHWNRTAIESSVTSFGKI